MKSHRFGFLRRNRFFETTPLTGYSFIQSSKNLVETCFWNVVIMIFTAITIVNVREAIIDFMAKPTRTFVRATSSTNDIRLSNLSFVMNTSLIEYTRVSPLRTSYDQHDADHMLVQTLLCNMRNVEHLNINQLALKYSILDWVESLDAPWNRFSVQPSVQPSTKTLSNKDTLIRWNDRMNKKANELYDLLYEKRWLENENKIYVDETYQEFEAQSSALMNDILDIRPKYTVYYLMLLEALSDNRDPRNKLINTFGNLLEIYNANPSTKPPSYSYVYSKAPRTTIDALDKLFLNNEIPMEVFNGTAEELLTELNMPVSDMINEIYAGLDDLLHISVTTDNKNDHIPIYLNGWSYDTLSWNAREAPFGREKFSGIDRNRVDAWQSLKLRIVAEGQRDYVKIKFYSYTYLWFNYLIDVFVKYFEMLQFEEETLPVGLYEKYWNKKYLQQGDCKDQQGVTGPFDTGDLFELVRKIYGGRTILTLVNEQGNSSLEIEPFKKYSVTIKPTAHIISETDTCYNNSYEFCTEECKSEMAQEACGCIPGRFLHNSNEVSNLCTKPCAAEYGRCTTKCQKLLEHPCNLSLYFLEQVTQSTMEEIQKEQPLFELEIRNAKIFNHPQFVEIYEMTFGGFLAKLGGLMELWIGINVIGILHVFVYCVKQLIHTRDPNSRTSVSLRNLFGKTTDIVPKTSIDAYKASDDCNRCQAQLLTMSSRMDNFEQLGKTLEEKMIRLSVDLNKIQLDIQSQ